MRIDELLLESAENDLDTNQLAQSIATKFTKWLTSVNGEKILYDTPMSFFRLKHRQIDSMIISGSDIGLPREYCDLKIGIGWYYGPPGKATTRGLLTKGVDDRGNISYYVLGMVQENPMEKTDVVFMLNWNVLIHEITHYLDYKRASRRFQLKQSPKLSGSNYYNDPFEMNAHFQQGLTDVIANLVYRYRHNKDMAILDDFEKFKEYILPFMPKSYHLALRQRNRKRFMSRLYKLYTNIKEKWPDIPAIKKYIETFDLDEEKSTAS